MCSLLEEITCPSKFHLSFVISTVTEVVWEGKESEAKKADSSTTVKADSSTAKKADSSTAKKADSSTTTKADSTVTSVTNRLTHILLLPFSFYPLIS